MIGKLQMDNRVRVRVSFLITLITISSSLPILAETIYKCADKNGVNVFSQTPCGQSPEKIEIREYTPPAESAENKLEQDRSYNEEVKARLEIRKWKLKEASLVNRIKALEQERDRQISVINDEINESWDHQKNRTREMRIESIKGDYRRKIDRAKSNLREHRATER